MQSKRWTLRLDPETRKLLDQLAVQMQRSRANVIKVLIHKAANPVIRQTQKRASTKKSSAAARS